METGECGYGGQDCGGNKGVTIFEKPDESGDSPKPSKGDRDDRKGNSSRTNSYAPPNILYGGRVTILEQDYGPLTRFEANQYNNGANSLLGNFLWGIITVGSIAFIPESLT